MLTRSSTFVNTNSTGERRFAITDTKLYIPVVTISTQDNAKLLQQLKSGFKGTVNWTKYQVKTAQTERKLQYLDFLINLIFQRVKRRFALSFKKQNDRTVHTGYYFSKVEMIVE